MFIFNYKGQQDANQTTNYACAFPASIWNFDP
jgi:hypothetical protein